MGKAEIEAYLMWLVCLIECRPAIMTLTAELSGWARCLGRGQTRPAVSHGPLERVVSHFHLVLSGMHVALNRVGQAASQSRSEQHSIEHRHTPRCVSDPAFRIDRL